MKKFTNVKLYGEKPNIVITPSKNGAKKITKNLLFSKVIKLISKFFFQIYTFWSNLYFECDYNQVNEKNHEPKLYQILL